jgi:hypothetical protein
MGNDLVTFRLDGEVTIDKLSIAFTRFSTVLDTLRKSRGANVRWVLVGLDFGSAAATARAVPLDDDAQQFVPTLCDDYLRAARQVARGDADSDRPLLRVVRELTAVADESNPIVFETADDEVIFLAPASIPAGPGAGEQQTQTTKSLGAVRGRVEMLSQRNALRFSIYDLVNDRAVSCYPHPDHKDVMREAWGLIADVSGTVTRDVKSGRPLTIRRVTRVEVVAEGDPDGYLRARGALRTTEPAEQVVRRLRDVG